MKPSNFFKRTFSTYFGSGYYSSHHGSKSLLKTSAYVFSGFCLLYFQEGVLSKLLTEVQTKYYHYQTLFQENKQNYETNEQRKQLFNLFEPERRISYLNEKISQQLHALEPFDGDFLSLFVSDKLQQIKDSGAQIYLAQSGGGKTMEGLRIAEDWKKKEGPVLFFDELDYGANIILEKYGISHVNQLKKVLKEDTEIEIQYDVRKFFQQINQAIMPLFQGYSNTPATKKMNQIVEQRKVPKSKNNLLIIIDDADDLRFIKNEANSQNSYQGRKEQFLLQVKELVKEGYAKVLFLCKDPETEHWLKSQFDAGVWKGIYGGSADLKSKEVIEKYMKFVSELTGVRMQEAEKFFDFFGVDFKTLVELKHFIQKRRTSNRMSSLNIDDFIQEEIEAGKQVLKAQNLEKSVMKVCKNLDKDWRSGRLTPTEKERLVPFFGEDGSGSLKYKAAAYSMCGKSWKSHQKEH